MSYISKSTTFLWKHLSWRSSSFFLPYMNHEKVIFKLPSIQSCALCAQRSYASTLQFNSKNENTNNAYLIRKGIFYQRLLKSSRAVYVQKCHLTDTSFLSTIKEKLLKYRVTLSENYSEEQLSSVAEVLLNGIYMKVPHGELRTAAGLEDSFSVWLSVVYLHLWLLFCRLKAEGQDGEIVIKAMVDMLWSDLEDRLGRFEDEIQQSLKLRKLFKEFHNLLTTYFYFLDEGILGSDVMLASSLWSLIYNGNPTCEVKAYHLEHLVHYIRFNAARIEKIPSETLFLNCDNITWPLPQNFS